MERIIDIKVSSIYIVKSSNVAGSKGESNASALRIAFDESWDGYAKSITFYNAKGENPYNRVIVLTTDKLEDIVKDERVYIVPIPEEAMRYEGMLTFVIQGKVDNKVQKSIGDVLEVKYSPDGVDEWTEPTPDELQQIQTEIESIKSDIAFTVAAGKDFVENKDLIEEAIAAGEFISTFTADAVTLPPDQEAYVEKKPNKIEFGIPEGKPGVRGPQGVQGPQGSQGSPGVSGLPTIYEYESADLFTEGIWLPPYSETRYTNPSSYFGLGGFMRNVENPGNDMWSVVLTAGENITVVIPDCVEWAVAEPTFTQGHTYYLSFIPLVDKSAESDAVFKGTLLGVWVAKELTASE